MSNASSSRDSLMSPWAEAPLEVLKTILQHVQLHERLNVCSLVCQSWRKAAVGASTHIKQLCHDWEQDRVQCFEEWLEQHGSNPTSIEMVGADVETADSLLHLTTLPCSNLRNLDLSNFSLQLAPTEDEPEAGLLSQCTGLTRLALDNCLLFGSELNFGGKPTLTEIQNQTSLQELTLRHMATQSFGLIETVDMSGDALAALTQLTKLILVNAAAKLNSTLQHLSRLTALKELRVGYLSNLYKVREIALLPTAVAAATLAGIGQLQQLTSLVLFDVTGTLSRKYLAGRGRPRDVLTALRNIQHMRLERVTFEPALLAGMTQLTSLQLSDMSWVVGARDFSVPAALRPPSAGRGAYKLLLVLPALQELRQLRLDIRAYDWPKAADQMSAYSALTANSKLEHLELQQYRYPLPAAAWKHVFRKGLQLPAIAGMTLEGEAPGGKIERADERVVSCCPIIRDTPYAQRSKRLDTCMLQLRWIGDSIPTQPLVPPSVVRLLEVNADDAAAPSVPAVLPALTHLKVAFAGDYHEFAVTSMSESQVQIESEPLQRSGSD